MPKQSIRIDSLVGVAKDVISCDLDGETALLNVGSGIYYGLDEVGTSVWHLLSSNCTVKEIIKGVTSEYDVDVVRCEADIIRLLQEMAESGLIELNDKTGT